MAEYNELTPAELSVHASLFTDKVKQDQEKELFYAYVNAYWQRVEKLEPFETIMGKEKEQKKMTEDQMLAKVLELNKAFGGTE